MQAVSKIDPLGWGSAIEAPVHPDPRQTQKAADNKLNDDPILLVSIVLEDTKLSKALYPNGLLSSAPFMSLGNLPCFAVLQIDACLQ
jgi:hypothetical protein